MNKDQDLQKIYQAILETAVDGIIIINNKGIITLVNKSAEEIFCYSKEELIGQNVSILMNSYDAVRHDHYLSNYFQTQIRKIIGIGREVIGRKKDGELFPFRLAISQVILNDQIIFTGIVHDLKAVNEAYSQLTKLNEELDQKVVERTYEVEKVVNQLLEINTKLNNEVIERKIVENDLIKKEMELQRSLEVEKHLNELKSKFVTTASHEFRTPLATIISSASLISKYVDHDGQENRERHIEKIKKAVVHLTGILNDFLSLSKLEEGKIKTSKENIELKNLINEVSDSLTGILKENQTIEFLEQQEYIVFSDKNILKNILFNLISNAIKYSSKKISITIDPSPAGIQISIIDSGIGIPDSETTFLFERFFRASNVGNQQGTGLGLHIVKKYCDMIRAEIDYKSKENKGSTFTIYLPTKNDE